VSVNIMITLWCWVCLCQFTDKV